VVAFSSEGFSPPIRDHLIDSELLGQLGDHLSTASLYNEKLTPQSLDGRLQLNQRLEQEGHSIGYAPRTLGREEKRVEDKYAGGRIPRVAQRLMVVDP
jgi:hypothetical protein